MAQHNADVIVLGGGPAGGAAALELAQSGCEVVLLERQQHPGWKIGETVPPEIRVHLERLNHWDTFQNAGHRPCYGIVSCWGDSEPLERDFLTNPWGHGWQLDRPRFEGDLLQAAEDTGCKIFFNANANNIDGSADGWQVQTSVGTFHTKWLLDCTGRNGTLAATGAGGSFVRLRDYVSLYCILKTDESTDRDGRTYVESCRQGWAYSALMPNGSRIIAFLTDRDLIPSDASHEDWLTESLQQCPEISRILQRHSYKSADSVHLVATASGRYEHVAGSNWALVGDAGMTFDPLSGWGSTKAIVSARAAVAMVLHGNDYQTQSEELWANYLSQYRDYYLAERRWPDETFWARRHAGLPGVRGTTHLTQALE